MASTIFGASVFQEQQNGSSERYDVLGADSAVIATGDVLTIASGVAEVAVAATAKILGVATKKATMPSPNDTVYPPYVPADGGTVFLMGANATLTDNETSGGVYYGLTTGGTGTQQIDVVTGPTTTTSRQVVIVKVDPNNVGGTEGPQEALVKFVSTAFSSTAN